MTSVTTLNERVVTAVTEVVALANKTYPGLNMSLPTVDMDCRGKAAGWAYYDQHRVSLNRAFLLHNTEQMFTCTIPHEVAHLVSYKLYGKAGHGHGLRWRSVMQRLGITDDSRCHTYDVSVSIHTIPHTCGCPNRVVPFSQRRTNALRRNGPGFYRCRRCRQPFIRQAS